MLRSGYSTLARVLSFGWLALCILAWIGASHRPTAGRAATAADGGLEHGIGQSITAGCPCGRPASLRNADETITKFSVQGDTVTVSSDLKQAGNGEAYVFNMGTVVEAIGKAVQSGHATDVGQGAASLVVDFSAPTVDGSATHSSEFMTMVFSVSDLKAVNYKTLQVAGTLNLTSTVAVYTKAGFDSIRAYCGKNADTARNFCATAPAS